MNKLTSFNHSGKDHAVSFVETSRVCDGVSCDVYTFSDDPSRDLGIVYVSRGYKTPLQKVLLGEVTIEGYLEGAGTLTVKGVDEQIYTFDENNPGEVAVSIGQIMQWEASGDSDLVFYEICQPPYQDGRFENIAE